MNDGDGYEPAIETDAGRCWTAAGHAMIRLRDHGAPRSGGASGARRSEAGEGRAEGSARRKTPRCAFILAPRARPAICKTIGSPSPLRPGAPRWPGHGEVEGIGESARQTVTVVMRPWGRTLAATRRLRPRRRGDDRASSALGEKVFTSVHRRCGGLAAMASTSVLSAKSSRQATSRDPSGAAARVFSMKANIAHAHRCVPSSGLGPRAGYSSTTAPACSRRQGGADRRRSRDRTRAWPDPGCSVIQAP